ncbi:MAG: I78 family peptidase inhibitor [Luteimonas sp.]
MPNNPVLACASAIALGACAPAVTSSNPPTQHAVMSHETSDQAVPMASRGPCDAAKAQSFIGQPASADVMERARTASDAATVRTLLPNQPITKEFNGERLNLHVDATNNIVSINCG